eukprot:TRINITY_DN10824_c0_g2_i1.p3 TRINITY_DN10824_c0_g2~~TRINITY_DN10824_c0_g2_i1.p3  ORF type:complete len:112 (-),score=0.42 TRINITY_DN10824_c0_g2_i1:844-1179(-)
MTEGMLLSEGAFGSWHAENSRGNQQGCVYVVCICLTKKNLPVRAWLQMGHGEKGPPGKTTPPSVSKRVSAELARARHSAHRLGKRNSSCAADTPCTQKPYWREPGVTSEWR